MSENKYLKCNNFDKPCCPFKDHEFMNYAIRVQEGSMGSNIITRSEDKDPSILCETLCDSFKPFDK